MANGAVEKGAHCQKVFLTSSLFPLSRFSGEYPEGEYGSSFSLMWTSRCLVRKELLLKCLPHWAHV